MSDDPSQPAGEPLGPYVLVGEIGRGAQGVVYRALDTRLGRYVALKLLKSAASDEAETAQRFRREAEAAGRIDHPNVCTVYEAGIENGQSYIAMQYVEGPPLSAVLSAATIPTSQELEQRLDWLEQIAAGLGAAHDAGLIHRDIKPGNVLLAGGESPVLVDFGLVRMDEGIDASITQTGDLRGTPAYMAPEQIHHRSPVDARTDVYALGVLAYQLVSGRRPFEGTTWNELFQQILSDEPVRPVRCSRDLWVVLQTAMAKDPNRRYASVADFGEDLRRVRAHEPIRARPAGPLTRIGRWARRRPALALSLLLLIGSAMTVAVQQSLAARRLKTEIEATRSARDQADRRAYLANVRAADVSLAMHDAEEAARRLQDCPAHLRGWEWEYLHTSLDESVEVRPAHTGSVLGLAGSVAGRFLASASLDGTLILWEMGPDGLTEVLRRKTDDRFHCVAVSRDGDRIATGATDSSITIWRPDGSIEKRLQHQNGTIRCLAFSADGRLLLSGSQSQTLAVYDLQADRLRHFLEGFGSTVRTVVAGAEPQDAWLGTGLGQVVHVDLQSGRRSLLVDYGEQTWCSARWGGYLLFGLADGTARLMDASSGEELEVLRGHTRRVTGVAFLSSTRIATTSLDGSLRLWNAEGGEPLQVFVGHEGSAASVTALPLETSVVTGGIDGTLRRWVEGPTGSRARSTEGEAISRVIELHPDDRTVLVAGHGGRLFLHDAWTGDLLDIVPETGNAIRGAAFTSDGSRLLTACIDGSWRLWDWTTKTVVREVPAGGSLHDLTLHPDGRHVATAGLDGCVREWEIESGALVRTHGAGGRPIEAISYGPRGRTLAVVRRDGAELLYLHDQERPPLGLPKGGVDIDVSPDGSLVAVAGSSTVTLFSTQDGRRVHELVGHSARLTSVAFHPDGSRLATTGYDQTVRLWDTKEGVTVSVLRESTSWVRILAWSRSGDALLSAASDRSLQVWRAERPQAFFSDMRRRQEALKSMQDYADTLYESGAAYVDGVAMLRESPLMDRETPELRAAFRQLVHRRKHRRARSHLRAQLFQALANEDPDAAALASLERLAKRYEWFFHHRWSAQGPLALVSLRLGDAQGGLTRLRRYMSSLARSGARFRSAYTELVHVRLLLELGEREHAIAYFRPLEKRITRGPGVVNLQRRQLMGEIQRLLSAGAPR